MITLSYLLHKIYNNLQEKSLYAVIMLRRIKSQKLLVNHKPLSYLQFPMWENYFKFDLKICNVYIINLQIIFIGYVIDFCGF